MSPIPITSTILVTGAGGFIGRSTVPSLLAHGYRVKAMVRRAGQAPFESHPRLAVVRADMRDADSLTAALQQVTAVVHLAAAKSDEKDSEDVNVGGARRLVEACQRAGCRRLINISTLSTKIARQGAYARTKSEADRMFRESGLAVTTLLPSVVYGEELDGVFGTIVKFVQQLPVVPVLGNGQWISAPVYMGDVCDAIIACLERDVTIGRTYDLGGADPVRFSTLIDKISGALGIRRRKIFIPFSVALAVAQVVTRLLPKPPITISNVLGSNQDVEIDIDPARRDFGFNPIDLDGGIRRVLGPQTPVAGAPPTGMDDAALGREARLFGRYLLGVGPSDELAARYAAANRALLAGELVGPEVAYALRHPSALPFLDAACALLNPASLLRKKILIMTAVLEASPAHTDFFLKPPPAPVAMLLGLAWQGIRAAAKVALGLPLYLVARRAK
ncbi:MAG TPA: NAD-dependent epimerase/dehydratase family protein [Verrucomicrobiae bacterium]|nr:NAD-dependent epimerase/dehydratase family protein [Verrucomicrobiae bacterium]